MALDNNDYLFYHASEKIALEVFPEAKENQVILLKDFDEMIVYYRDDLAKDKLSAFLDSHLVPIVSDINQKVVELVFKPNGRPAIMYFRSSSAVETESQDAEFRKVAEAHKNELVFIQSDIKDGWGKKLGDYLGIEAETLPQIEYYESKNESIRYKHTGKINVEEINKFIEDTKKGVLPRFLKSEPLPTENPGPVYKAVGKNFKEEILDNDNDILMKFYAPWCGHCKKLEPIYKSIAELLKANSKLKFYDIDATKNDVEGHPVTGFPVIKLFPGKNKSNAITFEGERNEADIIKFLKEKCSNPIVVPTQKPVEETKSKDKPDL